MRLAGLSNRVRLAVVLSALLAGGVLIQARSWKKDATYVLANIGLSEFLAQHLGLQGIDDHGIDLGGIGSDLWHGPGDGPGIYWMITDRGPNGEDPRTFPVPEFTPFILKVRTSNGVIEILQAIPINGFSAAVTDGVTGIPNLANTTEPPALNEAFFGCNRVDPLGTNSNGLDTEGLVRTRDGNFWIVEEYSPSILKVDPQGRVVKRFMPTDLLDFLNPDPDYATDDSTLSVPKIYGLKRKINRGFEGLAISPDEKTLYVALQSPLVNPTTAAGNAARNTRILAFDIVKEEVVAEYVYRFQPATEFETSDTTDDNNRPRDMKVSGLTMLDQHRILVLERTDFIAKTYVVDLRKATNILGTVWDDVTKAPPSLEQLLTDAQLELAGIIPLPKEFVATFDSANGFPQKIEGMTVLDSKTIAIANDNDFGIGSFSVTSVPPACTLNDSGRESQIIVIRLDDHIK